MKLLSSASNPLIKKILHLQEKSKVRKEENLFVIDGWKETQMALENEYEIKMILCAQDTANSLPFSEIASVLNAFHSEAEIIQVSAVVFDKIAVRGNTTKVVAIAQQKEHALNQIKLSKNPIILVLDAVEKPGNLGAILRVADAGNVDAVLCCSIATDIYNSNVIRSSVGCIFSQKIAVADKKAVFHFLKENNISVYTTSLKSSKNYLEIDYKKPSAFIFGTEAVGVDAFWETHSTQNIIIPMRGQNDSLNVSNSAAIVLFEALRQRSK